MWVDFGLCYVLTERWVAVIICVLCDVPSPDSVVVDGIDVVWLMMFADCLV